MRNNRWQLHAAKNKLSRVIVRAQSKGPQTITRRGTPAAVVISMKEYEELTGGGMNIVDFFQSSPLKGVKLDLKRDRSRSRIIKL